MRLLFAKGLLFFLLFAIAVRLFYWQVVMADELSAQAEKQHFKSVEIQAYRGKILFSNGATLAGTKPTFTLFAQPKIISNSEKSKNAQLIAEIFYESLPIQTIQEDPLQPLAKIKKEQVFSLKNEILEKLNQDLFWVALKRNLDYETKQKIRDLKIYGLGFDSTTSRFYPEGSSSAHLLGFLGSDANGQGTGYFGIEGFYDRELKGLFGSVKHEKDAAGLPILIGKFFEHQARNGKDLVLNLDQTIQYVVEQSLKKGIEKYGAKAASAIVMDPKTGAILGLASYPNYDPGNYFDYPKEFFKNSIVADQYEPGSTFKVLTMAAAINEGAVKPETKCGICSEPVEISGFLIKTWNGKYYPNTTMTESIVHSDNTGMVFMAKKLGLDKMYDYIEKFGFGQTTNIDLQDESVPNIRPKAQWREIDLATASFGQGIAVTPIQMVSAVSAIANGGSLMEPHVVKGIKDEKGVFDIKPRMIREVVSKETAEIITEMMVQAVDQGEARVFKPKGFKIAGKTGTAQIPVAGHYDPNKTIASFVGFAPADDPKFVMLIRYDQPTSSIYGSETAAPTFFEIAKELFPYFKIAPSGKD